LEVEKKQFEDTDATASEPAECEYYYSGYNYRFFDTTNDLKARVYDDEPGIAHLVSWQCAGKKMLPTSSLDSLPSDDAFFRAVLYHLTKKENCIRVDVLTNKQPPYEPLGLDRFEIQAREN
jgi:hypothetical protein